MKSYLSKFKNSLCVSSLLFMMFGIIGPLEIYANNQTEFSFGFVDFFWMFIGVYSTIWIIGSMVISFLPYKLNRICNFLLFSMGILCYIQRMFLNKALIRPDGGRMNWGEYKSYTIFNTFIWIIVFVLLIILFVRIKNNWEKISNFVVLFLFSIQLIAALSIIISVPKDRTYENECKIDATEQFALAKENNIIVFVLDRYANDQFEISLEENPDMEEFLKDFTYYDNANSVFENTGFSLTLMLAGQEGDVILDNKEEQWSKPIVQSFYDTLHENGYRCFISTRDANNAFGNMNVLVNKYDNVKELSAVFNSRLLLALMTKMVIYQNAPYIIKPQFEVMTYSFQDVIHPEDYSESIYLDPEFYQALINEGFYIDEGIENQFKVQHIQGMHSDYNMNDYAIEIPISEGTIPQQRNGLNMIIKEYINQLKELGVYDNSTIIITADHGDASHDFGLQPTVLIKRSQETHDNLIINHAPISHEDFIPTILSYLGEDYSDYGTSIYDWNEGDERERHIIMYGGDIFTYYTDRSELEQYNDKY